MSRSWVEVDAGAIATNVEALIDHVAGPELCAVVKADGYGHGAVTAARAALEGGATRLAVAQVDEGALLRDAGVDAPIWVLSEPEPHEFITAAGFGLEPAVYSLRGIEAAADVAQVEPLNVHLKLDTGMRRVGAEVDEAVDLAASIVGQSGLELGSVWTHCAVADEPDNSFTDVQMDRFDAALAALDRAGIDVPLTHAANSAGTLVAPRTHRDVVRCGIAIYGLAPSTALEPAGNRSDVALRPALSWRSRVSFVKRIGGGEAVSYGLRAAPERDVVAATVPVGYADGYRRGLWADGAVLIGGVRRPILGVVTMDQIVVDCGDDEAVAAGDDVVLLGRQDGAEIGADHLAAQLGTINYEITCGISKRVERVIR